MPAKKADRFPSFQLVTPSIAVYDPNAAPGAALRGRMRRTPQLLPIALLLMVLLSPALSQEAHEHSAPERLGSVSFPISCVPAVQEPFNRGVALLHSFAYTAARHAFEQVSGQDQHCAIAHWGVAMTYFHQLWDPPLSASATPLAEHELDLAERIGAGSERE